MAIRAVVRVGVISLAIIFIHVLAMSTPDWIVGKEPDTFNIGMFQLCFKTECIGYGIEDMSFGHVGSVGLHIVGAVLLFANAVYSLRYCRSLPDGQAWLIATKSAIILGIAGGCVLAGVVWFPLYLNTVLNKFSLINSKELEYGFSFYLGYVSAVAIIIFTIIMSAVASQQFSYIQPPQDAGPTYPMTSPVGLPHADPDYGYDR